MDGHLHLWRVKAGIKGHRARQSDQGAGNEMWKALREWGMGKSVPCPAY